VMAAWAGLGYYARARNLLACARVVAGELGGRFPDSEDGLRALPGIGPYTAAAIAAIAFGRRAVVVDGNVERVMARLHAVETPLPAAKRALHDLAARLTPAARSGDHAQAVMDLGATICTPRVPACGLCPWRDPCAGRRAGIAAELPRRVAKPVKPVRRGIAYLAVRDGAVLVETRPARGLLGGMLGLPCSEWSEGDPVAQPPFAAAWRATGLEVRHTFTHFHLVLAIETAEAPAEAAGRFAKPTPALAASLPTVMRKALRLGLGALAPVR
jgi:A/G-specific adenine glycosylase